MKKLLIALAFVLVPTLAIAGWNIQQRSDNTAVYINNDGETVPAAGGVLNFRLADVSTASTAYLPIPFDGKVKAIYTVLSTAITTADSILDISTSDGTTSTFTPYTSGSVTLITVTGVGSGIGDVDSITPDTELNVTAGGVLAIHTSGASTTASVLNITVVLEAQ